MHPILFKIGPFTIYTYGVMIAVGVLFGLFIVRREAKANGLDPDVYTDLCFYAIVAAVIGSRVFYVATNLDYFIRHPADAFKLWEGGLVFYGGFLFALPVVIFMLKKNRLPIGLSADIAAVAVPLAHGFGRIGCFMAGCCYGKTCNLPWAVTFRDPVSLAPVGIPLHPTQLYSSCSNFFIFVLLYSLRKKKSYDGQLLLAYISLYAFFRFIIEFFRNDFRGVFIAGLSISQVIALTMVCLAFIAHLVLKKRNSGSV